MYPNNHDGFNRQAYGQPISSEQQQQQQQQQQYVQQPHMSYAQSDIVYEQHYQAHYHPLQNNNNNPNYHLSNNFPQQNLLQQHPEQQLQQQQLLHHVQGQGQQLGGDSYAQVHQASDMQQMEYMMGGVESLEGYNPNNYQMSMQQNYIHQHQTQISQQAKQQQLQNNPINPPKEQKNNQNTQDDPNFNSIFIFQNRFDVPKRYELLVPIGIGGYGVVAKAFDKEKQDYVAIKKIFKPFLNPLETKRILREIKILKALQHDNVISIRDVLLPVPKEKLEDIYIVSQLMDTDLHQIITSEQPISEDHIQYFMYQLLCGLKYIHSAGVFHRDLKPGNLLVNSDCELKICDFGLARTVDSKVNVLVIMTEYVATRWYRAPELLLSWNKYTTAIDMWAVGCIFTELFMRKPLLPGESYLNQLILTLNLTGTPQKEDLENIQSDRAKQFIMSLGNKAPKDLAKLIPNATPVAIDLISKMIVFNPEKRISAEEALKHPFFESLRDPEYEVSANKGFQFDFEREDVPISELKDAIYSEMQHFHPGFDENNPDSYALPIKSDSTLFTLDYDGSKIFIDYSMGGGVEQSQQVVQNIQQIQEKMVKDIIGVDGNGKMIQGNQNIQMAYNSEVIYSPSQIEQSTFNQNMHRQNYAANQFVQQQQPQQQIQQQAQNQTYPSPIDTHIIQQQQLHQQYQPQNQPHYNYQQQQQIQQMHQQQQHQQQYQQQQQHQQQQQQTYNSVYTQNVQVFDVQQNNRIQEE